MNEYEAKAFDIASKLKAQEKIALDFGRLRSAYIGSKPAIRRICENEALKRVRMDDENPYSAFLTDVLARVGQVIEEILKKEDGIVKAATPKEELTLNDVLQYIEGFNAVIREEGTKLSEEANQRITFPCHEIEKYMRNCGYIVKSKLEYSLKEYSPLPQLSLYGRVKEEEEKQSGKIS